ncbi:MAG: tetratricopeptide repeat protein [Anaerolineae bacterium]|nr:tetratricopeptide repeat protein [Anaerolineae bacterium]
MGNDTEQEHDLSAVRDLLRACYDAETMLRFLLYCGDARLQALREEFAPGDGMTAMVEKVIVHAGRQALLDELLARVAEDNPGQYARFAKRLPAVTARGAYAPPAVPDLDVLPEPGPLPPGSRMPFARNATFTGREEALKALAQGLLGDGQLALVTQAIQGMGGVGKTQLAVEFAWRYGRFFRGVHWMSVAQPEQIGAEIAACGEEMGLRPWADELPEQIEQTLVAWRGGGPRLVVLDNLEDVAAARGWWPRLQEAGVRVVVTARRSSWPGDLGMKLLRVRTFSVAESIEFLRRHLDESRAADGKLQALHERLGGLPLALELAGRYLARQRWLAVGDYLERVTDAMEHASFKQWREELGNPTRHDLGLRATFDVSWEQVEDKGARRVFLAAAWCAPNVAIPCEVLARAAGLDEEECGEALAGLVGLGLLEGEAAGPTIHPLVGEYGRGMRAAGFEPLAAVAVAVSNLASEAWETGLPMRVAPLGAHLWAVAEAAEGPGLEEAGTLWGNVGCHLHDVAEYAGARAALERALRIDKAALGPEHPKVAIRINNLGVVLKDLGDLAGARAAYEQALRIDEATFGPEHPNVATDVSNLGVVLKDLGDLAGARALFERALRIDEATFGLEHPNVARDVNNLGTVLQDLGDLAGAQAALERALRIDEAALGPEHPAVARDVNNLGSVLLDLGDLARARAAFEWALRIWERTLPAGHPNIEMARRWLDLVLREME